MNGPWPKGATRPRGRAPSCVLPRSPPPEMLCIPSSAFPLCKMQFSAYSAFAIFCFGCGFVPLCALLWLFQPLRPLREAFFPVARVGCARSMSGPSRGSRTVEDNPPAGPIRLSGAPAGRPDNSPGPGRLGRRPGSKATTPKLSFFLLRFGAPQARQTGEGKKRAERWNANRTRHPASTPGRLVL